MGVLHILSAAYRPAFCTGEYSFCIKLTGRLYTAPYLLSFCKCGTACCAACSIDGYICGVTLCVLVVYTFCCRTCDFQFFVRCCAGRSVLGAFWCVGYAVCLVSCLCTRAVYFYIWFTAHIALMMHTGINTTFKICHN